MYSIYKGKDISWKLENIETGETIENHLDEGTHYFIVGEQIDPKEANLENKIRKGEAIIKVSIEYLNKIILGNQKK